MAGKNTREVIPCTGDWWAQPLLSSALSLCPGESLGSHYQYCQRSRHDDLEHSKKRLTYMYIMTSWNHWAIGSTHQRSSRGYSQAFPDSPGYFWGLQADQDCPVSPAHNLQISGVIQIEYPARVLYTTGGESKEVTPVKPVLMPGTGCNIQTVEIGVVELYAKAAKITTEGEFV